MIRICQGGGYTWPEPASCVALVLGPRAPPPASALGVGKGHVAHYLRRVREIMGSRGFLLDLEHHLARRFVIPSQGGWIPTIGRLHPREEHGRGQERFRELEGVHLIGHDIRRGFHLEEQAIHGPRRRLPR